MKRIKKEYLGKTMTGNKLRHSFNTSDIKEEEYPFYEKMGFGYIFEDSYYQEQIEHIDLPGDVPDYISDYKQKKSPKRKKK